MVNLQSELSRILSLMPSGKITEADGQRMAKQIAVGFEDFIEKLEMDTEETVTQAISESHAAQAGLNPMDRKSVDKEPVMFRLRSYKHRGKGGIVEFEALSSILKNIRKKGEDIRPLLTSIQNHFFATNKKLIFSQMGPGQSPMFVEYRPMTLARKKNIYGGAYPMLVDQGDLMRSLTDKGDDKAVHVVGKASVLLGTKVKYAEELQTGNPNMEARPPVQANPKGSNRFQVWLEMARGYININGMSK